MQLDLFILARHAEVQGDLLNMLGVGWDSVTVTESPENVPGVPDGTVAVVAGTLVARVSFHQITETNRDHQFSVTLVDDDGGEIGRMGGGFTVARVADIPVTWSQNTNIVLPFQLHVPRFGGFTFSLEVDGQHLGDRSFRVIDGRELNADAEAA